ncbi:MAG: hypothetical protein JWO52_2744, partial [Gammaproteobacteria bacterium]|nr:hypothetical protein [Gammaproteobacteria bacterium]
DELPDNTELALNGERKAAPSETP